MNNTSFTIEANVFRAACLFTERDGFRHYLSHVFIGKDGKVLSSNGHVGFISSHDSKIKKDYLIKLDSNIPASARYVHLKIIDNDVIATTETALGKVLSKRILGSLHLSDNDARIDFPADTLISLIPDRSEVAATTSFFLNASYLYLAGQAFGNKKNSPITITNYSNMTVITSKFNSNQLPEVTKIIIMKIREGK